MQQNQLLANTYIFECSITVGTTGGATPLVGYSSIGSLGAISPVQSKLPWGNTLSNLIDTIETILDPGVGKADLFVSMDLVGPQGIFTYLLIEDGTNAIRTFTSASATFSSGRAWSWGNGSNPVYVGTDAGKVRSVKFVR